MSKASIRPVESDVILVPTDFTEVADFAVRHANHLARIFRKEICLLHVVESGLLTSEKAKEQKEEETNRRLAEQAEKNVAASGIPTRFLAKRGNIFDTIGAIADEINAALVVMGTHGVIGMQHVVGSKALRVITNANRPFVVVQKKDIGAQGYKHIVLPIDFSRETKQKLLWAVELSKVFHSTFHILADHESDEYAARAVNNNMAYAENFLRESGCEFTVSKAPKGDFTKETIRFAKERNADLIIIMTNQNRELSHYIIGPYEQNVIANEEKIPVMTLNPVDNMSASNGHLFNFANF